MWRLCKSSRWISTYAKNRNLMAMAKPACKTITRMKRILARFFGVVEIIGNLCRPSIEHGVVSFMMGASNIQVAEQEERRNCESNPDEHVVEDYSDSRQQTLFIDDPRRKESPETYRRLETTRSVLQGSRLDWRSRIAPSTREYWQRHYQTILKLPTVRVVLSLL